MEKMVAFSANSVEDLAKKFNEWLQQNDASVELVSRQFQIGAYPGLAVFYKEKK